MLGDAEKSCVYHRSRTAGDGPVLHRDLDNCHEISGVGGEKAGQLRGFLVIWEFSGVAMKRLAVFIALISVWLSVGVASAAPLALGSSIPSPSIMRDNDTVSARIKVSAMVCTWASKRSVRVVTFFYKSGPPAASFFMFDTKKGRTFAVILWGLTPISLDSIFAADTSGDGKVDHRVIATAKSLIAVVIGNCQELNLQALTALRSIR